MIQDDFERFQAEADGMIGQLTPDLDAFLGYKTEIFNVEEWADIEAWDKDDSYPIAKSKAYINSYRITFEARGYIPESNYFIKYDELKLRIVEDDGWYELVDSVPSAYLRMMLRSTFNSFLASKSKLNVKTEDEWTWLARPFWQQKITQYDQAGVYHYVPMQDFSHPWTDEMLYEMYDITDDERKYIESMIKPMKDEEAGQLTINFS